MRKFIIPFLLLFPLALSAQSFPILRFQKFYGHGGDDLATCLERSADDHLLLGGTVEENEGQGGCTNIWVVKVNEYGKQVWEREFGGSGCDELRDMVATPDGGVIFVGITSSFIEHPEKGPEEYQGDYFLGKLNADGEIEWLKTYGGLDVDQAFSVTPGPKGEYVVVGASNSMNFDVETDLLMSNNWMLRINERGEKILGKAFGGNKQDWAFSVAKMDNGDFVFAGYTNSEDLDGTSRRSNGDAWVGRFDRYGKLSWQQVFSGKFEDYFQKVIIDKDGRIVCVGNFETEDEGKQFWFLKLTGDGKKMYERIFGDKGNEFANSIYPLANGGYILTGFSRYYHLNNEYIKGGEDFWLVRLDSRGNVIWMETYGGREDERGMDVIEWEPGVYFALGQKRNDFENRGRVDRKKDFWLLKVEEGRCDDFVVRMESNLVGNSIPRDKYFKMRAFTDEGESFLWDFGDGNVSRDQDPVYKYERPGVYEIKLTVFKNENCAKTITRNEYVIVW